MPCMCGDSECPSCGTAQGTRTLRAVPKQTDLGRLQDAVIRSDVKEITDVLGFSRSLGPEIEQAKQRIRTVRDEALEVAQGWENLYRHVKEQRDALVPAVKMAIAILETPASSREKSWDIAAALADLKAAYRKVLE